MKRAFAAPGSSVTAGSPIFRARMHGLSANGPVGSADGLPLPVSSVKRSLTRS